MKKSPERRASRKRKLQPSQLIASSTVSGSGKTPSKVDGRSRNGKNNVKGVRTGEKTTKKAKRHETEIKELKEIAAKTAAANNILNAKVKSLERKREETDDGAWWRQEAQDPLGCTDRARVRRSISPTEACGR